MAGFHRTLTSVEEGNNVRLRVAHLTARGDCPLPGSAKLGLPTPWNSATVRAAKEVEAAPATAGLAKIEATIGLAAQGRHANPNG